MEIPNPTSLPPNVIPMNGHGVDIIKKASTLPTWCEAQCRHIEVDTEYRIIKCVSCGRVIDAFEYLAKWANESDRQFGRLKEQETEVRKRNSELSILKHAITRERSKLRRVNRNSPELSPFRSL